ncbi:MAG: hypothetical protein IPJ65_02335 [Archangiaceae bacterium]|nr:hypothetical protein [Archangiaceae bacterium]
MPRKTPEQVRAALLKDPNTSRIAAELKMGLDDYLKLVVHFATTGAEPRFFVVPDDELKKQGHVPPDLSKMNAWLRGAVATKAAHESTGYSDAKKSLVSLGN